MQIKGFTPNPDIETVTDYLQEYAKVTQALRETDNPIRQKHLKAYCRKIGREIKLYDKYRGTNYGAVIYW